MKENKKRNRKYKVNIYFSGFCTYKVKAMDKDEAVIKARRLPINETEIISNLENWKEADEALEYLEAVGYE